MARMYPQWISDQERRENPGKRAEFLVYDLLDQQLGDQWLVLYGKAIKWEHKYGVSDRETEFIVAHPDLGALALEVKGGAISYENGRWYTTWLSELSKPPEERVRHALKQSPYEQVTDAAKAYRRKIRDYIITQRLDAWDFELGTAVCFPDIEIPKGEYLGADALESLTLDLTDLQNLKDRLYEILKLYQKRSDTHPPRERGIEILKKVFARDWHLDSFMSYQLQTAEESRKRLTEQQFDVLYNLQHNTKMLIAGCAGSGKTMIAARKTQILAQQGFKVLLTCYNSNLADWLKTSDFAHANMRIAHFHDLCTSEVRRSKSVRMKNQRQSGLDADLYYGKYVPEKLESAAIDNGTVFDAIIVDEGQDFYPRWLEILYNLIDDREGGIYYIFYDDNQRIYNREKIPFDWFCYRLSRNMRNTNPVFGEVRKYYHQPDEIRPSGIDGPNPWIFDQFKDEYAQLQSVLARLEQEKILLGDIAILTPVGKEKSKWGERPETMGNFQLVWNLNPFQNQITVNTIHGFKGLERPVIILTEIDKLYPSNMAELLYIAASRAKDHLVIIGKLPQ